MNHLRILIRKIIRHARSAASAVRNWFLNLKFHWKLQILILFPILISYFTALMLYDYSMKTYDLQLYEDSAAILSLSTQNIENEMQNLLNITAQLSTNENIQDTINALNASERPYEEYTNRQKLMNSIYTSLNTRKYILSVSYLSPALRIDTVGSDTSSVFLENQAQDLYDTAFSKNGKASWVNNESDTLLVCPIQEVEDLSLRPLGAIIIRIQIDKLVQFTMNLTDLTENFYIYRNNEKLLYHYGDMSGDPLSAIDGDSKYAVAEINGTSSFVVRHESRYSDWSYYYVIPNSNIFARFTEIKTVVFLMFSGLYILLTAVSLRFSGSVTLPIKKLAGQMSDIQNIDFETSNLTLDLNRRKDEIGQLQNSYQYMIKRIEQLIQKNYKDRLLLQDTRYKMLQSQLNPHFIYNTLDSVYWMALNNHQTDIASIVFSLGKLLRENMRKDAVSMPLITLRQELVILSYYMNIQKSRFHEKLEFSTEISEEAQDSTIPRMLLQPLVENSISYGVEQTTGTCKICLRASVKDELIHLEIEDNGIGVECNLLDKLKSGERKPHGHGIGLANIEQRLQLIYGEHYRFSIKSIKPTGTLVTIEFPSFCEYTPHGDLTETSGSTYAYYDRKDEYINV